MRHYFSIISIYDRVPRLQSFFLNSPFHSFTDISEICKLDEMSKLNYWFISDSNFITYDFVTVPIYAKLNFSRKLIFVETSNQNFLF